MMQSPPLLSSGAIQCLKIFLSAATLVLLYLRYKEARSPGASPKKYSLGTKVIVVSAILFSSAVFHNVGALRGGTFVHYGEMFHYYLGSKYFEEVGYYELYDAVIAADTEQGNALAGIPFFTDLRTYRNIQRDTVLPDVARIKGLFSEERWSEFKSDVAFFKTATGMPRAPGLRALVMDHGYNASPVSTYVLGKVTNATPVTRLWSLAVIDVVLVAIMVGLVFRTFGFEMGSLFSIYFYTNVLNDPDYIAGGLMRFDWLLFIVAAVCLLHKERYASAAFFLTLSAMIRVFPALLFLGIGIGWLHEMKSKRVIEGKYLKFALAAAITGILLFWVPAVSLGSQHPWRDFLTKTELHDSGVYVNHLGFRGLVLLESSQFSLDGFIDAYRNAPGGDIVGYWQSIKEKEFAHKRAFVLFCSAIVVLCLRAIIQKKNEKESDSVLWPLLLVYALSYISHYYYAFLCLFVLLFFRRTNPLGAFAPLCLLLAFNVVAAVTKYLEPSPIVYYSLMNVYLFACLFSILCFELYTSRLADGLAAVSPAIIGGENVRRDVKRRRKGRALHK